MEVKLSRVGPGHRAAPIYLIVFHYLVTKCTLLTFTSQDTHDRAQKASIETLPTDVSFVTQSDYILSIVPPRDALATAKRITTALSVSFFPLFSSRSPYASLNIRFLTAGPLIRRSKHAILTYMQQRSNRHKINTSLLPRPKRHLPTLSP